MRLDCGPLPVISLLFCLVWLIETLGTSERQNYFHLHWLEFFAIGLGIPALLAAAAAANKRWDRVFRQTRIALSIFLCLWLLRVILVADQAEVILLLCASFLALFATRAFRLIRGEPLFAVILLTLVAWTTMMPQGVEYDAKPTLFSLPVQSVHIIFVLLLILATTVLNRECLDPSETTQQRLLRATIIGIFSIIAIMLSFRFENIILPYNWGYFTGPANVIRAGGWLLRDVPSQYGLLNVLAIARIPMQSTWDAMRVLISILTVVTTIILFAVYYCRRRSWTSLILALAVSIAFGEFEVGSTTGDSFFTYPSSGPLRFIWVYIILAIVAKMYVSTGDNRSVRTCRIAATTAWVIGSFWSAESAIYCSCTWLPALLLTHLQSARRSNRTFGKAMLKTIMDTLRETLIPLALVVFIVDMTYLSMLRSFPDWSSFYEFGLLYAGGLVSFSADPYGSEWLVLLVLGVVLSCALVCLHLRRLEAVALLAACWGAVWAEASYYMARSVNNNVNALLSLIALVIGLVLLVTDREQLIRRAHLIKAACIPILVWGMLLVFGNLPALSRIRLPFSPGYSLSVSGLLPLAPPDVESILRRAHVNTNDPLVYAVTWFYAPGAFRLSDGRVFTGNPWLPVDSINLFAQLPSQRQAQYVRRFITSHPSSGWLLSGTSQLTFGGLATCADFASGETPSERFASGQFVIEKCRPAIALTPGVPRPRPIEDSSNRYFGSVDEIYSGAAPTYGNSSEPIVEERGKIFHVRGWVARIDTAPVRAAIELRIDGSRIWSGHYGEPRPDIPNYLSEQFKRDGYSGDIGFTIPVDTTGLKPGAHLLEIVVREPKGLLEALKPAFPFTLY